MGDIGIKWDSSLAEGDIQFLNNDLVLDNGLTTAVLVSIFTDRRALDDDILPDMDSKDVRGWWGDRTSGIEDDFIGSRLWLLERGKTEEKVIQEAKQILNEALAWMVEDKVAAKVEVEVERQGTVDNPILAYLVKIFKVDGSIFSLRFDSNWEAQFNVI